MKRLILLGCLLGLVLAVRAQTPIVWTADSVRRLNEFPRAADYGSPWLSPDGLRLYFIKNSRAAYMARRPTPDARFGVAQPVRGVPVAPINANNEYIDASYSSDELTVWYALSALNTCNDRLYYRTRTSDTAAFGAERRIYLDNTGNPFVGCTTGFLYGPTISRNRQELYLTMQPAAGVSTLVRFRAIGVDSFAYAGHKEAGLFLGASQLLDSDLTLLAIGSTNGAQLRQLTRASAQDTFGISQPITLTASTAPNLRLIPTDIFYQPACRRLVIAESTPTLRVMSLYTNVTRAPVQQTAALLPEKNFQLSPNPAHHTVRLTGLPPTATTLHVIDMLGRTVRTSPLEPHTSPLELSVEALPPGLYTVRVGAATRRLIVE